MKSIYVAVLVGVCSYQLVASERELTPAERTKKLEQTIKRLRVDILEQEQENGVGWQLFSLEDGPQTQTPQNSPVPAHSRDFIHTMLKAEITKQSNIAASAGSSRRRLEERGLPNKSSSSSSGPEENTLQNLKLRGQLDDHKTKEPLMVLAEQVQKAREIRNQYERSMRIQQKELPQKAERERKRQASKSAKHPEQQLSLPNQVPSAFPVSPSEPLTITTTTPIALTPTTASPRHEPIPGLYNPASPTLLLDQETPVKAKPKLGPAPQAIELELSRTEVPLSAKNGSNSPTLCC